MADRLADEGFTVLAPDLFQGELPEDEQTAESTLREADPNYLASATLSAAGVLHRQSPQIQVIGMGMGGSLGLWASVRLPTMVTGVVSLYGAQNIDFAGSRATYQIHLAAQDPWLTRDDAFFMEATMGLAGVGVELYDYPGTTHGFFEEGATHDPEASRLAWGRILRFLRERVAQVAGTN
jgi:carboxymethylenebutenolidase